MAGRKKRVAIILEEFVCSSALKLTSKKAGDFWRGSRRTATINLTYRKSISSSASALPNAKPLPIQLRLHPPAHMEAQHLSPVDNTEIFKQLDTYPWDNDKEFQVKFTPQSK